MDPSLQPLLSFLGRLPDQFRDIRTEVENAVRVIDLAPSLAVVPPRKVLDFVVREVYERCVNEPPGTRPLEGLTQRLVKEGHLPPVLEGYASLIRQHGNTGAHHAGKVLTAAHARDSLLALLPILDWYVQGHAPGTPAPPVPAPLAARPETKVAVVPKGLRSFDANDADFFLDLLPGPQDKDGLPESIRFWKHRVEERDEPTFTVGVIYGPSGCGKSSLVKAGLLPRLARHVLPVYVEATADDTEARLLKGLRKRCSSLTGDLDLTGAIAALGRGEGLDGGQKVFIVLDQFEQWLHARRGEEATELAQALRQCDGEHVQCVVLVRDDFWMALTRFMQELDIDIVPGQNTAVVDLFDLRHAKRVLTCFGQAFGTLPETLPKEQEAFLDQAVAGLSQDGRVISVRLALFAEMVKGRPWTPATLKDVGGMEGVGVAFLEETFSAPTAPPQHRYYQTAARALLKALLPEAGTDIRGHMRSQADLLKASGYSSRPEAFDRLIRLLDREIRLISPTDPEGKEEVSVQVQGGAKDYQLTHDYLVPALREWLTRKQKETKEGQAELLLEDCANLWVGRRLDRPLPTLEQWKAILMYTQEANWFERQRHMMDDANAYHARSLWNRLLDANTAALPAMLEELVPYRRFIDNHLRQASHETGAIQGPERQLHASLTLLPADATQLDYLYGRLLDAEPHQVPIIRDALRSHKDELLGKLWAVVESPEKGKESQRLRAAAALAEYDSEGENWATYSVLVVNDLVRENPIFLGQWSEAYRPVRNSFLAPLADIFRDQRLERATERTLATNLLSTYAAAEPVVLADLLMDADDKQFAVIYPKFMERGEQGLALLMGEIDKKPPSNLPSSDEKREKLGKRQATAAVALLRMNQPEKVWPLLRHSPDPRVRSYLIHRLSPLGADARAVVKRLDEEPEVSARRALLLALGEYGEKRLSLGERDTLLPRLLGAYRDDPDPGLHGAAEWLLLRWGQQDKLKEIEQTWREDRAKREERLGQIRQELAKTKERGQWYVNGQGQTIVVIPGPVEFLMGSPPTEAGREGGGEGETEVQHRKWIGRSFAVAAREVTVEQFLRFRKNHDYNKDFSPTDDCPVNQVTWYDAAAYCNWLSEQEGFDKKEWCYLPNKDGEYAEGMRLAPDYLHRTGYRLPSEAEWEYACRAGAVTSRYYGEGEELLGKYAWYTKNSQDRGMLPGVSGRWGVPGGRLKPNDLGLFDMLGNAVEWCQESVDYYSPGPSGEAAEDIEDKKDIKDKLSRVLRGGSFGDQPRYVRSAHRVWNVPAIRDFFVGVRPARIFR